MAEINIAALKKLLAEEKDTAVFFVCGGDAFLKKRAVDMISDVYMPDEFPEFNYDKLDFQRCDFNTILGALTQMPQFSDRRLVIIDNMVFTSVNDENLQFLCEAVERPVEGTVTVFRTAHDVSGNDGAFKKFYDLCKKNAYALKLDTPDRNGLCDTLCEESEAVGARLKPNDAFYLIDRCGADLSMLVGELSKLAAFAGRKNITRQMIDELCPASLESKVFNISKAILRGRADEAFRLTENLLMQRNAPNEILSIMSGDFIDLYRAKAAKSAGVKSGVVAESFSATYKGKAFRVDNAFRDCNSYPLALLEKYIRLIFRAAVDINSARTDKNIRLEQLISELCLAGRQMR